MNVGCIVEHPEMDGQRERIAETLIDPQEVVATVADESVHAYQRFYRETPVTSKYLVFATKISDDDAFVITAYYSSRKKKGKVIWPE